MRLSALPAVLRGSGLHAQGDRWIADAIHLRVRVWRELGFPLHPFAAWRVGVETEPLTADVNWTDSAGSPLSAPFDLDAAGGEAVGQVVGSTTVTGVFNPAEWLWFQLDADGDLRFEILDTLVATFGERVLGARSAPPYAVAALGSPRIRVRGSGTVRGVAALNAVQVNSQFVPDAAPDTVFGLPIPDSPWYATLPDPITAAKTRLTDGCSLRLGPPDQPDGSFDPLPDTADANLILGHWAPGHIDDWLEAAFRDDPATVPVTASRSLPSSTTPATSATAGATDALLTMAADPRIARYLGLATAFTPAGPLAAPFAVWIIAAQWAVQTGRTVLGGASLGSWLRLGQAPAAVAAALDSLFPALPSIRARFDHVNATLPGGAPHWSTVTLLLFAVAAVGTPPDLPAIGLVQPGDSGWNAAGPAESWTQRLVLPGPPPIAPVGFARISPGGLVSLHRREPAGSAGARAVSLIPNWSSAGGAALLDTAVPPGPAGAAWRLWASDEFGRWGPAVHVDGPEPGRPPPPAPVPEVFFQPADTASDGGPRSPGQLDIMVPVPDPAALAPGSRPLQRLDVAIDGNTVPSTAIGAADRLIQLAAPVGAFAVAERRSVTVTATFVDAGGQSATGTTVCAVADPRTFPPAVTGPQLIWTARPDPTGRTEAGVQWQAPDPRALYRVYLGDERILAAALGLAVDPSRPRADRALAIWQRRGELADKQRFALLTEEPVGPDSDGVVRFRHQLPAGLRGVQFLRVVPVSAAEVEGNFASCGLVPLAVPGTDAPPAPTARVTLGPDGTANLRFEARGLRSDLLAALGVPGDQGGPECRVRRTRGRLDASLYMPPVAQQPLESADGVLWTADVTDPLQVPFVRHVWVAEVRYPPEPALAAGATAVSDPLAVTGLGPQPPAFASPWSAASLPVSTVLIPDAGPPPVSAVTASRRHPPGGPVTIVTVSAPVSDPRALGPWRVAAYRRVAGQPPALLPLAEVHSDPVILVDEDQPVADAFDVALIDPVGRQGPASRVMSV